MADKQNVPRKTRKNFSRVLRACSARMARWFRTGMRKDDLQKYRPNGEDAEKLKAWFECVELARPVHLRSGVLLALVTAGTAIYGMYVQHSVYKGKEAKFIEQQNLLTAEKVKLTTDANLAKLKEHEATTARDWALEQTEIATRATEAAERTLSTVQDQVTSARALVRSLYLSYADDSPPVEALWSLVVLGGQEGIVLSTAERMRLADYARRVPRLVGMIAHEAPVRAAALLPKSPDANVLTADLSGRVSFWRTTGDSRPLHVATHNDAVTEIVLSSDGRRAITVSRDKTGQVWDAVECKAIGKRLQHDAVIIQAALSADGTRVLTAGLDGIAKVWDEDPAGEFQLIRYFECDKRTLSANISPDGTRVVTCAPAVGPDAAHYARVWEVSPDPNHKPQRLRHDGRLTSVQFAPDGGRIVTTSADGTARIWSISETGEAEEAFVLDHGLPVQSAVFDPVGKRILTVNEDDVISIWNADTGGRVGIPLTVGAKVRRARFSSDGRCVVIAAPDGVVRVQYLDGAREVRLLRHPSSVWDARFSANGQGVLTSCNDGTARFWELPSAQRQVLRGSGASGIVSSGTFDLSGTRLATVDRSGTVHFWMAAPGAGSWRKEDTALCDAPHLTMVEFAGSDSEYVFGVSEDGTVKSWNASDGVQRQNSALAHSGPVRAIEVSRNGAYLATATDRTVEIWEVRTMRRVALHRIPPDSEPKLAFSEDAATLAVGNADGAITRYSVANGTQLGEPLRIESNFAGIRLDPSGELLVATYGECIRVFDAASEEPHISRAEFRHNENIIGLEFLYDGRFLIAGSAEGTVTVWDLGTSQRICDLFKTSQGLLSVSTDVAGRRMFLASDLVAWVEPIPQPKQGTAGQLEAWAKSLTGVSMQRLGELDAITAEQWREAEAQLETDLTE